MIAQADAEGPETRARILRAAFQLFHEQGFHATGVATILREAGANPGSLYHFFQSKEDLLRGTLEFALEYLGPAVMEPVEQLGLAPVDRVFALLENYRAGMVRNGCRMGCPIGNLALEVSDGYADVRTLIDRNFANWTSRVESWLVEAGDQLPRDIDRARLARFVLTVMEGGLMQARAANDLGPFDDSVAVLRDHFALLQSRASRGTAHKRIRPRAKRR